MSYAAWAGTSDSGFMRTTRSRLGGMTAQIGADGHELFGDPRPEWLTEVTRLEPEPRHDWVNLEEHPGFQSTQRLWIGDPADSGGVLVATWPAELQSQARYLYGRGLGSALVAAANKRGWTVEPSPHLAYWRAPSSRRLYMCPSVESPDYVACWEDKDALRWVRSYTRDEVEDGLWQWLKERRFADNGDNAELRRFLDECLPRKQRVHMRPGPSIPPSLEARSSGRTGLRARRDDPQRFRCRVRCCG
jgi:hypothetical protein